MKVRDCGDGTFEITETVSEINDKAIEAGLPPPMAIFDTTVRAEGIVVCTRITDEEARFLGIVQTVG